MAVGLGVTPVVVEDGMSRGGGNTGAPLPVKRNFLKGHKVVYGDTQG